MLRLNYKQENIFKLILNLINQERKAFLIHLLDSEGYLTTTDITEKRVRDYPQLEDRFLEPKHILKYCSSTLSDRNLGILEQRLVKGRRNKDVRAWKLTENGKVIQPYVRYSLETMVSHFNQSMYAILGSMNSTTDKRITYTKVLILKSLEERTKTVSELSEIVNYQKGKTNYILEELSCIKDGDNKELSFVKIHSAKKPNWFNYRWKGPKDISQKYGKKAEKIINIMRENPLKVWIRDELTKVAGCNPVYTNKVLNNLIKSGYVEKDKLVELTFCGRFFLDKIINPILKALQGDKESIVMINNTYPKEPHIKKVLEYYVNIKGKE